jgi:hypothetical protein
MHSIRTAGLDFIEWRSHVISFDAELVMGVITLKGKILDWRRNRDF